ncbi:hypothetical protein SAMN05720354_11619 [Nitrosospira sp. Nsp1]|nr:hypothetical protein SAMN05720354_11619 [Nitrosospira sp. Nsp1]
MGNLLSNAEETLEPESPVDRSFSSSLLTGKCYNREGYFFSREHYFPVSSFHSSNREI